MLAVRILRAGWQGRVTAQHARAMSLYPDPYFRKLTALLSQAGMSVVSDPHTGPLHARVRDLRNAGIPVALGQDDIADAYYPFGRNNMLEVGFLASHLLWMTSFDQLDAVYDMITTDAARALGMSDFALAPGNEANLVVHATDSVWRALREHDAPRWVLKRGNVV
jgi:cytosine deaminase